MKSRAKQFGEVPHETAIAHSDVAVGVGGHDGWQFAFAGRCSGKSRFHQIDDYRGKWVVLEFWNLRCVPCLKRDLPAWVEFYKQHEADRQQFEILSICVDVDEDLESIAQVEKRLAPVVKHVWNGRPLPFPMLLDSGLKTCQSFGLDYMAQTLLIDPEGNLTEVVGHQQVLNHLSDQLAN